MIPVEFICHTDRFQEKSLYAPKHLGVRPIVGESVEFAGFVGTITKIIHRTRVQHVYREEMGHAEGRTPFDSKPGSEQYAQGYLEIYLADDQMINEGFPSAKGR